MEDRLFERVEAAVRERFAEHYLRDMFRGSPDARGGPSIVTANLKHFFEHLGKTLGYSVSRSWLYDLIWYKELGYRRQTLILESELHDAFDSDDFSKLIQARADVRVWVATIDNTVRVAKHIENCKQAITEFEQTEPGDSYLFIIHDWLIGEVSVHSHRVT